MFNDGEARRDGDDFVLALADSRERRGDRLLVATGRRPRVDGVRLETVGITPDAHGIPVDARMQAGERLWAIGDVTGIWPLTHVGEYQGEVVASNILGEPREAGERLQQATLAIRARVPLEVLRDTTQPFPSFSDIHAAAIKALRKEIASARATEIALLRPRGAEPAAGEVLR